jgi:HlyD family secretion protein
MSTEIIKDQPFVTGINPGGKFGWVKTYWTRLLAGKKKIIVGGGFIAAFMLAGFYFWGDESSTPQYMTARIEKGNLRNTVSATGSLQAVTTVQVGSQASGTISALFADFNSVVKKGQVVAQLDPSVAKAQVEQARANLEQARASLANARAAVVNSRAGVTDAQARGLAARSTVQNNQAGVSGAEANVAVLKAQQDDALSLLRQQESLLKAGVIAKRDYDVAQTTYRSAEARYKQAVAQLDQAKLAEQSSSSAGIAQSQAAVEQSQAQVQQAQAQVQQATAQVQQAQAALSLAEVNLSHTTITSPIDGVVVSRDVNVGQTVAASLSAPTLFTIANDLTQMQVIANIDQADIGLVEQAKSVRFSVDAFPGQEFDGQIAEMRLNPVNVQNVVTYNVVINVENPEQKLKPGMTANLTITIDERNNVLKAPNSALRFTPQDANSQRNNGGAGGQNQGQGRRRQQQAENAEGATEGGARESRFAPPSAPVLPGQRRVVWVLGADGKPERRRITVGLSDGSATEVVDGDLKEGDMVITGQTITGANRPANTQSTPPGFGNAPRGGGRR